MKKEFVISSTDGINNLHVVAWEPDSEPFAILQISHGMVEYIERYEAFAEYLNTLGIVVIGNDHLGHGHTAASDEDLGYFGPGLSETVVNDLHEVTVFAQAEYSPLLPVFLFGHSMGSFMARRYLSTYGNELTGAIICGTGNQPAPLLGCGRMVADLFKKIKGERHRPKLLKAMAFGAYNKRIKNPSSPNAWISVNEENVRKYDADKYCTYLFTVNGYQTLFDSILFIQDPENVAMIPKTLPLLFIAGTEDPVGNYGKGVTAVVDQYKKAGIRRIETRLFEGMRHEILNETDKQSVFETVSNWIDSVLDSVDDAAEDLMF